MPDRKLGWAIGLVPWMVVWGVALAGAAPAGAQAPVPVGDQFQINTYTSDYQSGPSVAADADGDFVVVWDSQGSSGTDTGVSNASIQGQRYGSDGSVQGAQFQVNSYTTAGQFSGVVAMAPDGDFVVVWVSFRSSGTDPLGYSIQAQRHASDGSPQGAQFQVNTYTTNRQDRPDVAVAEGGDFVVVWTSNGSSGTDTSYRSIHGQRYAADGSTQGTEFQVNGYTTNEQNYPAVAVAGDGDFVVVWGSYGSYGTDTTFLGNWSIQGQRYASNGSTQGAQFQVNSYTSSFQVYPSVAANAVGEFVVVWESYGSSGSDQDHRSVHGQRYSADGSPQGAQFQVNSYTTGSQSYPSVAAAADGDFVVAWTSDGSSGTDAFGTSIQGQRYASDGSAQGAQFQVNDHTTSYQSIPSVAAASGGDFVVAWMSFDSSGTDTSYWSVQAKRYASDGSAQGTQFQVNTYTTSTQYRPRVAATNNGDFVVVWDSDGSSGTDDSGDSIQGQRYASDGSAQGAEFQVNSYTTNLQLIPSVAVAADGDFLVSWWSHGSPGTDSSDTSIQAQLYASDGSAQGAQFQVNTYTTGGQVQPSVAAVDDRDFILAWMSYGSSATDTSDASIQGQRYRVAPLPVPALSRSMGLALVAAIMLVGVCVLGRRS